MSESPHISRDANDVTKVGQFQTLVRGAEKGKFYCKGCHKNLSCLVMSVPNDGKTYVVPCPRCKKPLAFNAAWLAAKVIAAKEKEKVGEAPAVGNFPDVQGRVEVRDLGNGRKLYVACPSPATAWAQGNDPK